MAEPGGLWLAKQLGLFVGVGAIPVDLLNAITDEFPTWQSVESTIHRGEDARLEVDAQVRSSRRLYPPMGIATSVTTTLEEQLPAIGHHFDLRLESLEEVQLLRYITGAHFAKHRDGRRGADGSLPSTRLISMIVMLSQPSEYEGGDLVLFPESIDTHHRGLGVRLGAGDLLAFPSDLAHQVLEVTAGQRLSAVTWAA